MRLQELKKKRESKRAIEQARERQTDRDRERKGKERKGIWKEKEGETKLQRESDVE
jgi:hypothetical protein